MISIKNLKFHYRSDASIFDDISTELLPGHIYGLLGLNGIGKTTFLKLIAGLIFPKSGSIKVNEFSPQERQVSFLSDIYFITDEVELPNWKIKLFMDIYSPLYPNFDGNLFYNLLEQFNIDKREKIGDLSYGQQKKVNIAFGIATQTRILLMDEPTNGLDIPSKTQFRKLLAKYTSDDKIIIISTHQIRDVHHLIDHILILNQTHLILDESIYDLGKKIKFTTNPADTEKALYKEQSIQGYHNIVKNELQEDSPFDIELLFNAISNDKAIIKELQTSNTEKHV